MRAHTIREIDAASRTAASRAVLSTIAIILGCVLYVTTFGIYYSDAATVAILVLFAMSFAGGWAALIFNVIIFVRIGNQRDDEPPNNSDSLFDFSEHRPGGARLEITSGNSIGLGRFNLSRNEWRKLATTLSAANWKWSRRLLQKTHVWESLTIGGRYDTVTSDFERVGALRVERDENGRIKSARVTTEGREAICKLAGTALL